MSRLDPRKATLPPVGGCVQAAERVSEFRPPVGSAVDGNMTLVER
jgi:hypothetical protein